MDFSSIARALESLHRRQPPLPDRILTVANDLSTLFLNNNDEEEDRTAAAAAMKDTDDDDATTPTPSPSTKMVTLLQELMGCAPTSHHNEPPPPPPRWESLAVGLFLATEIIQRQINNHNSSSCGPADASRVYMDGPRVPTTKNATPSVTAPDDPPRGIWWGHITTADTIHLVRTMHDVATRHLEHPEPRVRTLVANAVGAYSARIAQDRATSSADDTSTTSMVELESCWTHMHDRLWHSIAHHLERGRTSTTPASTTTAVVDDTTGWRAMETNWLCLASFMHGLAGQYYLQFPLGEDPTLFKYCAESAIQHVNRHVRAAAMQTYEQLIRAVTLTILEQQHPHDPTLKGLMSEPTSPLRTTLIAIVKAGLADNWSQVRMASSVLCRVWFQSLQTLDITIQEPILLSALLPRMCLNRFYLAQGVKLYSHETWKMIFGSTGATDESVTTGGSSSLGLQLVVENINAMIRYYIKMCDADNHAVREAACQAIAELAVRVGTNDQYRDVVLDAPQIQNLIAALLMCFYDESWPVRDEACLACGILCKAFPQACHAEIFHKTLWERFTEQLTDQIWSVRENAAVAIGDVLEAYGNEILPKVQALIQASLPSAKEQPPMSAKEYKAHVNDLNQHTDNQLYSCGSLAPKLRKGGAGRIGCTNCGIDRPKAPWEATDGCIYLIREYIVRRTNHETTIPISDDELIPICTELADVCRVRHFPQSDELRSTLWKCLPVMAVALGQQRFKNRYLDIFMDLLFGNLESSSASQLSHHAAGQCAEELASLIGLNMFRARLDDHQRRIFDQVVQERQMMPKGPAGGSDIFSPFGPPGLFVDVVPP